MGKSPQRKKKGKKDKADAKNQVLEEDEAEFLRVTLELRVKELETLNLGLTQKCDYLESQNEVFKVQLEDTKKEKEDLVAHLQRSWIEEKTNVKELEDRLYGVTEARTDDAKKYDRRLLDKDRQFEEMKAKLDKSILELGAKLIALEEFRIQRESLTTDRDELQNTLQTERKSFEEKFDELDRNFIIYREKLKTDSTTMLLNMAQEIQKAGKLCLTATVKTAISSNIRLQNEMETMAKDNIKLRDKLDEANRKFREKRMTIEVLEEENSTIHQKCNQYRKVVQELVERQLWMEVQMRPVDELETELMQIKMEHLKCKVIPEAEIPESEESSDVGGAHYIDKSKLVKIVDPMDMSLEAEVNYLRDIIVKMALTAKDLSEAANDEELEYLKGRFKSMLSKLYQVACEIPDLPAEVKFNLSIPAPTISRCLNTLTSE